MNMLMRLMRIKNFEDLDEYCGSLQFLKYF